MFQYRILLRGCWYELFGGDPDDFPTEMDDRREEELSQPLLGEESLIIRHSSSYQSLASDDSPAHTAAHLPLFLPGRVLHITEDGPSRRSVDCPYSFPHESAFSAYTWTATSNPFSFSISTTTLEQSHEQHLHSVASLLGTKLMQSNTTVLH